MKKLIFAFILIFLFAGCSAKDITDDKDNSQSLVIENPTSYLNTLSEYADEITIEDIISDEKLKSLKARGISAAVKSCTVVSMTEAETVIELIKDEHSLQIDTVLDIFYLGASDDPQNFHLGGFNITVDDQRLIVTQNYGITKYTLDTLEYIKEIRLFQDTFKLIDTVRFNTDYMSIFTDGRTANLLTFNEDGQVQTRYTLDKDGSSIAVRTGGNYNQKYAVVFQPHLTLLNSGRVLFTSANIITEDTAFTYYIGQKKRYKTHIHRYLNASQGEFYILDSSAEDFVPYVLVMKDGKPVQHMNVSEDNLMDGQWGKSGVTPKDWNENNEKITLVCNSTGGEITFDFKNKKVWSNVSEKVLETVIENDLQEKISDSPDGKYSLWRADGGSGGDVLVMDLHLMENRSGKTKYLDTIGGMYGGNSGCGFFSNGDIYTIMLEEFKVFTTDMSQQGPVFEMSKNFPLGDDAIGDGTYRRLLSARRDPATHSWAVLYHEGKYYEDYKENYVDYDKLSDNFFNSTYKIGILDQQGNLTKTYETGEYVMSYWFRGIKMHMETGDILYFSVLHKGVTPQLEAKIDLKTGEYTCISGGYNGWGK